MVLNACTFLFTISDVIGNQFTSILWVASIFWMSSTSPSVFKALIAQIYQPQLPEPRKFSLKIFFQSLQENLLLFRRLTMPL